MIKDFVNRSDVFKIGHWCPSSRFGCPSHGGRDEGGTSASYESDSTSVPI